MTLKEISKALSQKGYKCYLKKLFNNSILIEYLVIGIPEVNTNIVMESASQVFIEKNRIQIYFLEKQVSVNKSFNTKEDLIEFLMQKFPVLKV